VLLKRRMHDRGPTEQHADGRRVGRRQVGRQTDGSQQAGTQGVDDRRRPGLVGETTECRTVAAVARVTHDQNVVDGRSC